MFVLSKSWTCAGPNPHCFTIVDGYPVFLSGFVFFSYVNVLTKECMYLYFINDYSMNKHSTTTIVYVNNVERIKMLSLKKEGES